MGYAARKRAAQSAQTPQQPMVFGLTRRQKIVSFRLSFALAFVDAELKVEEKGPGGKTGALYVKLKNLEEHIGIVLDHYRVEKFHKTDLDKAAALFDLMERKIQEFYPCDK